MTPESQTPNSVLTILLPMFACASPHSWSAGFSFPYLPKCNPSFKCQSNVSASLKSCLIPLLRNDLSILEIQNFPQIFYFYLLPFFSIILILGCFASSRRFLVQMGPPPGSPLILSAVCPMESTEALLLDIVE